MHESLSPKRTHESPGAWSTANHYNIYSSVSNVSNSSFDLECDFKSGILNNNNNNDNDSNSLHTEHR